MAFGVGDICGLDFRDDTFDVTVAGNVLHLLADPKRALAELVRVTRPGGIVALPNYVNVEAPDSRVLWAARAVGFTTRHEWDEEGYIHFLRQAGMDVQEYRRFDAAQPLVVAICRV